MITGKHLQQYLTLRNKIDQLCIELFKLHSHHLMCRKGCDMCCEDFGLLPVEFYAIKELGGDALLNEIKDFGPGECPFLTNHACAIYGFRPIICRTQGLPLLFMGEENWELSACELNFTQFDFDEFSETNTFPQDRYNSQLFMLNLEFLKKLNNPEHSETDLLSLQQLFQSLPGNTGKE